MKRKDYRKPTMTVFKLQHQGMLMTSDVEHQNRGAMNVTYEEENL